MTQRWRRPIRRLVGLGQSSHHSLRVLTKLPDDLDDDDTVFIVSCNFCSKKWGHLNRKRQPNDVQTHFLKCYTDRNHSRSTALRRHVDTYNADKLKEASSPGAHTGRGVQQRLTAMLRRKTWKKGSPEHLRFHLRLAEWMADANIPVAVRRHMFGCNVRDPYNCYFSNRQWRRIRL